MTAQPAVPESAAAPWWRDAVCYEVYVRSYADADGDGYGDLPGITSRLEHLVDLGVDALWITPFYPSPQHDHGYDVANYRDVEPTYGDLAAFDTLLARAHELGLKVIVDIVPNHTSWDHPWFEAALEGDEAARARYYFRRGTGEGGDEQPPNNWLSLFGGGAWERVPGEPGTWYLHLFDASQPDLDWTNPEVGDEFEKTLRFWLDRGADGFRIDVAHGLAKDPALPSVDAPQDHLDGSEPDSPIWDRDDVHEVYRRWRGVLDDYPGDRMAVGEVWAPTPERTSRYVRPDELQQAFNFHFLLADFGAESFREVIELTLSTLDLVGADATWVIANHDVVRPPTRYGGGERGLARTRAATMLMLALPGSTYLYQGEELGLEQVEVDADDKQDPEYLHGRGPGRDGCRVPIPWGGERAPYEFGPGSAQPWLPQPDTYAAQSVAAQRADPDSTLAFYRAALQTRRGLLARTWAEHREVDFVEDRSGPDVLAFTRGDVTVLVNCGEEGVDLTDVLGDGVEVVLSSEPLAEELPPDAAVWLRPRG